MMNKFQSRKFWLALIGQVTGLVVLFAGPEHAEAVEAAAANIGALLLMALTGWGYIHGEAEIDRERQAGENQLRAVQAHVSKGTLNVLAGLLLAGVMLGCAATPTDRWYQARDTANVANKVFIAQADAGTLSDDQLIRWGEALMTVHAQLEQAKALLPGGGGTFDLLIDAVEAHLAELAVQQGDSHGPGDSSGTTGRTQDSAHTRGMGERPDRAGRAARHLHGRAAAGHRGRGVCHRQPGRGHRASREATPRRWVTTRNT